MTTLSIGRHRRLVVGRARQRLSLTLVSGAGRSGGASFAWCVIAARLGLRPQSIGAPQSRSQGTWLLGQRAGDVDSHTELARGADEQLADVALRAEPQLPSVGEAGGEALGHEQPSTAVPRSDGGRLVEHRSRIEDCEHLGVRPAYGSHHCGARAGKGHRQLAACVYRRAPAGAVSAAWQAAPARRRAGRRALGHAGRGPLSTRRSRSLVRSPGQSSSPAAPPPSGGSDSLTASSAAWNSSERSPSTRRPRLAVRVGEARVAGPAPTAALSDQVLTDAHVDHSAVRYPDSADHLLTRLPFPHPHSAKPVPHVLRSPTTQAHQLDFTPSASLLSHVGFPDLTARRTSAGSSPSTLAVS